MILPLVILVVVTTLLFFLGNRLAKRGGERALLPFVLRRTAFGIVTVLIVFTISFFLMRAVPGGPFDTERRLEPEIRRNLEAKYRLDRPLIEQYGGALSDLLLLDLGPSMNLKDYRVNDVIREGFPPSLVLGLAALFWMLLLGVPAGVIAALNRGQRTDRWLMGLAALGLSIPNFVLAGLLMIPLVFVLRWLPAAGLTGWRDLILPSFCLGAPFAAQVARLVRTGMLEVLEQDWIRTAHAKGLSPRAVVFNHALRGASIPVVTFLAPALAGILTGSLVIEEIFAIPGLGTWFVQAALNRDYPLALGMVLLYTVLLYGLNTLSDLAHAALDPRVDLS